MQLRYDPNRVIEQALALVSADEATVCLQQRNLGTLRFAENRVVSSTELSSAQLQINLSFGKKSGVVTIELQNEDSIESAVRRAEEMAKNAAESSEWMPILSPPIEYPESAEYFESTSLLDSKGRAEIASRIVDAASKENFSLAGYLQNENTFSAFGNSKGLYHQHKASRVYCSATARTKEGHGSSKVQEEFADLNQLKIDEFSSVLIDRTKASMNPIALTPGEYPAILTPSALTGFMAALLWSMSRREADEGRSFFSAKAGAKRIGTKLFSEQVTLRSDPAEPGCPASPVGSEWLPAKAMKWIDQGVLNALPCERYWAKKIGIAPIPVPTNLILDGGKGTLSDLIKRTERAILVTQTWYMRSVDPREILFTGLTRDGTFLVENGAIKHALTNFRFNESPAKILATLEDCSESIRCVGNESWGTLTVLPAVRVPKFNFSSASEAV